MDEITKYLSKIGVKGGSSKSERKRLASIANGKKGGRPKKKKSEKEPDSIGDNASDRK